MALNPCVKNVICTLSLPVLVSLKTIIVSSTAQLQSVLAVLQARSITLGLEVLPAELARDAALAVLQEAQSVANLLPLSLIEGCADLGTLQQDLSNGVAQATSAVESFANDATRTLSLKTEVDLGIDELSAAISRQNEFVTIIDECIDEAL